MARIKYYYDTETCKYERIKVSTWDIVLNLLGFVSVAVVLAIVFLFAFNTYFDSPKEALLKKENEELLAYYEIANRELHNLQEVSTMLQERDDNIYRVVFEAEPIPSTVRQAGIGGSVRYKDLIEKDLVNKKMIVNTLERVDLLKKQMYIQTKSYDEILDLALNKEKMLASIPAIQPVSNENLNRVASGYGMRMHPIHKVRKFHSGLDFSAPRGTPIYATGHGKVIKVQTSVSGYGKHVEIDHGFGYKTRYAHMSRFNIKEGQKIKRGECIGYVGNTGSSTAPHLHYEVHHNGKVVNPVNYLYEDLTPEEYEKVLELASVENQPLSTNF